MGQEIMPGNYFQLSAAVKIYCFALSFIIQYVKRCKIFPNTKA